MHQASHDGLTGLPNRIAFERTLGRAFADDDQRHKLALLFIDGDRFKQINDTRGHAAGDAIITATAQRCAGRCGRQIWWRASAAMSSPSCCAISASGAGRARGAAYYERDGSAADPARRQADRPVAEHRRGVGQIVTLGGRAAGAGGCRHVPHKALGGGWYLSPLWQSQPQSEILQTGPDAVF